MSAARIDRRSAASTCPISRTIYDQNIVAENVRVMGPMIVSAMFEELKVFQVVDRIVEQFQHGMLPIGPGNAGKMLYRYWREAPNRMSASRSGENFAAITLGIPGGESGGMVNREFNDLWIRFVSSVSSFIRQNEVDQLAALGDAEPDQPAAGAQGRARPRRPTCRCTATAWRIMPRARCRIRQVKFMINLLQDPGDPRLLRRARHVAGGRSGRDLRTGRRQDQLALPDAGDLRHDHHRLARQQRQPDQPHDRPDDRHRPGPQPAESASNHKATRTRPTTTSSTPASCGSPTPRRRDSADRGNGAAARRRRR